MVTGDVAGRCVKGSGVYEESNGKSAYNRSKTISACRFCIPCIYTLDLLF